MHYIFTYLVLADSKYTYPGHYCTVYSVNNLYISTYLVLAETIPIQYIIKEYIYINIYSLV